MVPFIRVLNSIAADQYKWLEGDLARVDRSTTPWLVAAWHPPWYSSYKAHYREVECMRVAMEELLYSYGVDIVFTGHVSNDIHKYISPSFISSLLKLTGL